MNCNSVKSLKLLHFYFCSVYIYSTSSFQGFLYFYYFLHCWIIVKTSKLWNNTYGWNHVVTKTVLNKSKYILYLRFVKEATLCLDDSLAHTWHSLNQLHEVHFNEQVCLVKHLFVRQRPYYGKNSSNKQREMTVHHYFKTWRSVNQENVNNLSFFKCSRKNHQALWWNRHSWGPPQERKTQSYLFCRGKVN